VTDARQVPMPQAGLLTPPPPSLPLTPTAGRPLRAAVSGVLSDTHTRVGAVVGNGTPPDRPPLRHPPARVSRAGAAGGGTRSGATQVADGGDRRQQRAGRSGAGTEGGGRRRRNGGRHGGGKRNGGRATWHGGGVPRWPAGAVMGLGGACPCVKATPSRHTDVPAAGRARLAAQSLAVAAGGVYGTSPCARRGCPTLRPLCCAAMRRSARLRRTLQCVAVRRRPGGLWGRAGSSPPARARSARRLMRWAPPSAVISAASPPLQAHLHRLVAALWHCPRSAPSRSCCAGRRWRSCLSGRPGLAARSHPAAAAGGGWATPRVGCACGPPLRRR